MLTVLTKVDEIWKILGERSQEVSLEEKLELISMKVAEYKDRGPEKDVVNTVASLDSLVAVDDKSRHRTTDTAKKVRFLSELYVNHF